MPAQAWCTPAEQGWRLVKQNAQRSVWRAVLGGAPYFLKYYLSGGWSGVLRRLFRLPACLAEWNSGIFALRAGIPAVRPAGYTTGLVCAGKRCALLVTEALEPAYPLNEFWRMVESDPDPRRRREDKEQLVELLGEMIARAHQAGLEHLDMHAANILVQPVGPRRYRTAFVDLHSARLDVPVSDRAVVRNLVQLHQWFRKNSTIGDRLRFLRAYCRWRNEFEVCYPHGRRLDLSFEQLVAALARGTERHAERLGAQRDRRLWRDGRYFRRLRLPGGWRGMVFVRCKHADGESRASSLVLETEWWRQQLSQPLRWFGPESSVCKESHSATVARALLPVGDGQLPVFVKRPRARNRLRALRLLLPPSRSARAWRTGHALLHRDIATARPLAYLERRAGPIILDSLLVTEALPGAVDLETLLRQTAARLTGRDWLRFKCGLAKALARHLRRLQERGFIHRDCKAQNILVSPPPARTLLWIDLDGVRRAGRISPAQRLAPLLRLHVSLESLPGLTRTDRVRFLQHYLARFGSRPEEWKQAWRALAAGVQRKQRALERRRAWKLRHYGRP
jgi:tRNA A-37 threonylcarbamoyl transferase component Bud32